MTLKVTGDLRILHSLYQQHWQDSKGPSPETLFFAFITGAEDVLSRGLGKTQPESRVFGCLGSSKLSKFCPCTRVFFPQGGTRGTKAGRALVTAKEADEGAVSFELTAAPCTHSSNLRGSWNLGLQLLCCMHLHNRYFLFQNKNGFPNNLLRIGVWPWDLLPNRK